MGTKFGESWNPFSPSFNTTKKIWAKKDKKLIINRTKGCVHPPINL